MTDSRRKKSSPAVDNDSLTTDKTPSRKTARKAADPVIAAAAAAAPLSCLAPATRGRLEGKVAFVTGAGGNIGADITRPTRCRCTPRSRRRLRPTAGSTSSSTTPAPRVQSSVWRTCRLPTPT